MTDVTDGDRMRAAEMLDKAGIGHDDRAWRLIGYVAAALAEERVKARAPFLALEGDLRLEASEQDAWDGNCIAAYEDIADRIRRAAEETE